MIYESQTWSINLNSYGNPAQSEKALLSEAKKATGTFN